MNAIICAAGLAVATSGAVGAIETFDTQGFVNGQAVGLAMNDVSDQFNLTYSGPGVSAAVFNTDPNGPHALGPDPDLLVDNGFVLYAQTSGTATGTPLAYDTPNDDRRNGNTFTFDFAAFVPANPLEIGTVTLTSLSVVDLDTDGADGIVVNDVNGETLTITLPGGFTADPTDLGPGEDGIDVVDLTGGTTVSETGEVSVVVDSGSFDFTQVVSLEFTLNGSGAIDDIEFTRNIPTPGAAALAMIAGAGLARRRR